MRTPAGARFPATISSTTTASTIRIPARRAAPASPASTLSPSARRSCSPSATPGSRPRPPSTNSMSASSAMSNNIGEPHGGLGVTLASQGFATGAGTTGIAVQAPQIEGVENIVFPSFVMGVPITNTDQWNNTLYLSDSLSKVVGTHTLKFGVPISRRSGQRASQRHLQRHLQFSRYRDRFGLRRFSARLSQQLHSIHGPALSTFAIATRALFAEDSWRARNDLTFNFGVRWDLIMPWWEKYDNLQTIVPGEQSVLYPNALPGLVVPGDPGIPSTSRRRKYHNFAPQNRPRLLAEIRPTDFSKAIFGDGGKSSIRASYGIFYTAFPGLSRGHHVCRSAVRI